MNKKVNIGKIRTWSLKYPKALITRKRSGVILILLGYAVIALTNCSPKTTQTLLPVEVSEAFSDSGMEEAPERWWTAFGDQRLNTMVDSALQSNFNLATAWQRLRAAQAVVDRESSSLFPDLEVMLQGEISQPQRAFEDFQQNRSFQIGLSSVYELDLWGRIRASIQAERFRAHATQADYQAAAISLSAVIVRTWYQLIEARNQLALVEEQIETNQKVLNLIRNRFGGGQIRGVDILRQQQLLESTREQKTYVESRIQVLKHQLAVLMGRVPQKEIDYPYRQLPELPPLPATGIPVHLIRRRPDVQSAFNLLQAADQDLAAAISNRYPRVSFSLSYSTAVNDTDNLFQDWAYSLAGNLLAPVFYGGELKAEVDRTEAVKQQRLYEYGQTVLIAFQEVEDALIQEKKQMESIQVIKEQVDLARKTYEQLQIEYFNGMSDYLDVLTALDQEQQLRRDLLSANLILLEYRIALYRALAGGFETARETRE